MLKADALEAKPIVERAMQALMLTVSARGRAGSDVRTAVGAMLARLDALLQGDAIGEPLANCFDLARKGGMTVPGVANVYDSAVIETPFTLGGKLIKNSLITLCCANGARIIADRKFESREDVEAIKLRTNDVFATVEEIAADAMDSATYMALVKLRAATVSFLVETARPLPRMLAIRFAAPMSTLQAAYRLYDDASRCDELRAENKVVHPAFMRPRGRALSA